MATKFSKMAEEGIVLEEEHESTDESDTSGSLFERPKAEVFEISFDSQPRQPNLQEAFARYRSKRQVSGCKQKHVAPFPWMFPNDPFVFHTCSFSLMVLVETQYCIYFVCCKISRRVCLLCSFGVLSCSVSDRCFDRWWQWWSPSLLWSSKLSLSVF